MTENLKNSFFYIKNFEKNRKTTWQKLQLEKDFCDVILACDDKNILVHKFILSSSSSVFRDILKTHSNESLLIYVTEMSYVDLQNLVSFMYQGEVRVAEKDLENFMKVAEDLKIKGLFEQNENPVLQFLPSPTKVICDQTKAATNYLDEVYSGVKNNITSEETEDRFELTEERFKHKDNNILKEKRFRLHFEEGENKLPIGDKSLQLITKNKINIQIVKEEGFKMNAKRNSLEEVFSNVKHALTSEKVDVKHVLTSEKAEDIEEVENNFELTKEDGSSSEQLQLAKISEERFNDNKEENNISELAEDNRFRLHIEEGANKAIDRFEIDIEEVENNIELTKEDDISSELLQLAKLAEEKYANSKDDNNISEPCEENKFRLHIEDVENKLTVGHNSFKLLTQSNINIEVVKEDGFKMNAKRNGLEEVTSDVKNIITSEEAEDIFEIPVDSKKVENNFKPEVGNNFKIAKKDDISSKLDEENRLRLHIDKGEGDKNFKILTQNKTNSLLVKDRIKINAKNFNPVHECNQCQYKTSHRGNLKKHEQEIHQLIFYPCDQCEYQANQKPHLKRHKLSVHDGIKFQCAQCKYKSTDKGHLKKHVQATHECMVYPCNQCKFKSGYKSLLKRHIKTVHLKK